MPRAIRTVQDAATEIRKLQDELALLRTKNINLHGRRVVNAADSVNKSDYVTRGELEDLDFSGVEQTIINNITQSGGGVGISPPFSDTTPLVRDSEDGSLLLHISIDKSQWPTPPWTQVLFAPHTQETGGNTATLAVLEKDQVFRYPQQILNDLGGNKASFRVDRSPNNTTFPTMSIINRNGSGPALRIDSGNAPFAGNTTQFSHDVASAGASRIDNVRFNTGTSIILTELQVAGNPPQQFQSFISATGAETRLGLLNPGYPVYLLNEGTSSNTGLYIGGINTTDQILSRRRLQLYPADNLRIISSVPLLNYTRFEVGITNSILQNSTAQLIAYNPATAISNFARVDAIHDIPGGNVEASLVGGGNFAQVRAKHLNFELSIMNTGSTATSGFYGWLNRMVAATKPSPVQSIGGTGAVVDFEARTKINEILNRLCNWHNLFDTF